MPVSTAAANPVHGYVKVHSRNMPAIQDRNLIFSPNGNPLGLFYFYRSPGERTAALGAAWIRAIELQARFEMLRFEVACWEGKDISTVEYRRGSPHA